VISLELLVVMLAAFSILGLMVPVTGEVQKAGKEGLGKMSLRLATDKVASACERARITGSESVVVHSLASFSAHVPACDGTLSLEKGRNELIIASDGMLRPQP
jgi:hypothetical protein